MVARCVSKKPPKKVEKMVLKSFLELEIHLVIISMSFSNLFFFLGDSKWIYTQFMSFLKQLSHALLQITLSKTFSQRKKNLAMT